MKTGGAEIARKVNKIHRIMCCVQSGGAWGGAQGGAGLHNTPDPLNHRFYYLHCERPGISLH